MTSMPVQSRILYVDDLEEWHNQVGNLLREYSYEVVSAKSAEDALFQLDTAGHFDLAIVDLYLAEQDYIAGVRLVKSIRLREPDLAIVILTQHVDSTPRDVMMEMGRCPWRAVIVEKDKFNIQSEASLLYQIESLLSWRKRSMHCFVAMPFRDELNDVHGTIMDVLSELGIQALRMDDNHQAGDIPNEIRHHLRHNSFLIADLSYINPNVMYELGFAQALGKPTLLLCQDTKQLPEFVSRFRAIQYNVTFSGISSLRKSLSRAIKETLEKPIIMPRPGIQPIASTGGTFVKFLPKTEVGKDVWTEIISPVIETLRLEEHQFRDISSDASTVQEKWANIQKATLAIAEITQGDPGIYYLVGASDALKKRGIILLTHKTTNPPFNLRDRANTVRYDISNYQGAIEAQKELLNRILACLSVHGNTNETNSQDIDKFRSQKEDITGLVDAYRKQANKNLDAYLQEHWTADQRNHQRSTIERATRLIWSFAKATVAKIEKATDPEQLDQIERDLKEEVTVHLVWSRAVQASG